LRKQDFLIVAVRKAWARMMTEARPFADVAVVYKSSRTNLAELDAQDWLEAFAAHPKSRREKAVLLQSAQSAEWSNGEQFGTQAPPIRCATN
jgi:hypothetical protein